MFGTNKPKHDSKIIIFVITLLDISRTA